MRHKYLLRSDYVRSLKSDNVNWGKAYQYAKKMEAGEVFPPVHIFFNDELNRWDYNDGRHRVMAAKMIGICLWVTSSRIMGEKNETS